MIPKVLAGWSKGATNTVDRARVPEEYVRRAVNVDPVAGGTLVLREGFKEVYQGAAIRGLLALGDKLLVADGTSLLEVDIVSGGYRTLRTIVGSGSFAGAELNGVLYFCTANECLEYDGVTVRQWGVPDVYVQPLYAVVANGGLQAGTYQFAMTYTDEFGREGGTDASTLVAATAGSALAITIPSLPAGTSANVYVSSLNGSTLYLQNTVHTAGTVVITQLRDDTAQCGTQFMRAPYAGQYVVSHNSVLAVAAGKVLQLTCPMQPHLVRLDTGFIQYPELIAGLVSSTVGERSLYVCADKCYGLADVEMDSVEQFTVLKYPAIKGTVTQLRDGRGTWMTERGQVVTDTLRGAVELHADAFVPAAADSGAAGVVASNGAERVVTALKGPSEPNKMALSDFYSAVVINP